MIVQPGLRIQCGGRNGTAGLIVRRVDDPGRLYLLGCLHVLGGHDHMSEVRLPEHGNLLIGRFERSAATTRPDMDAAIAELLSISDLEFSNSVLGTGTKITIVSTTSPPLVLEKVGAGSGRTRCRYSRLSDNYGSITNGMTLIPLPNGTNHFCKQGDSGAVWYNPITGKALGMHISGTPRGENAVACSLKFVMRAMRLDLYLDNAADT